MNARVRGVVLGSLLSLACVAPALADDTEIFLNQSAVRGVRPNILFILDTSLSMNTAQSAKSAFDPTQSYPGDCHDIAVYWSQNGETPPGCFDNHTVRATENRCAASTRILSQTGVWTGRLAQWNATNMAWDDPVVGSTEEPLECQEDSGVHGATTGAAARYARNDAPNHWTASAASEISWGARGVHSLYSGNYLNWLHAPSDATERSRLDIVQEVASSLISSIAGVNVGLMRFSDNGGGGEYGTEGGMVIHPVEDIRTSRAAIIDRINGVVATGSTPLSETLYEAQQYFAGRAVDYGRNSAISGGTIPQPSVPASRRADDQAFYKTPIEFQCQSNYVVLLTDGEPMRDRSADARIQALPGFASLVGSCSGAAGAEGRCLADVAEYMFKADLSNAVAGQQNVTTYTIGFGPEVDGSLLLGETAQRGGGESFAASSVEDLTETLQSIVSEIQETNSTFTTPSVSINAFNRTESLNELYVSVFEPSDSLHWPGNLKKYGLKDGQIVDVSGQNAVDPETGFFRGGTRSFWSTSEDGESVQVGGAVSQLPDAGDRNVYTYIPSAGQRALSSAVNRFAVNNASLTPELLGITEGGPTRENVIQFARGVDVRDSDADGNRAETERKMGDPLHARPALVAYGGDSASPNNRDAVVFVPTNDGFLHAVDAVSGREIWSFIPPELLGRLPNLYRDPGVANRTYGLDGDVRILKFDVNQDGIVDAGAGDRVWLYFGMRRGGRWYYALDVTDRSRPVLLWKLGPSALPGIGETWSAPAITRVRVGGATQNGENLVLIFGGGYDDAQENYTYVQDTSGHRIFMVDAATGALLWYAGGPDGGGSPDLALPNMTNSIPSRITTLDTDGDQFTDRLYAADMGGRIWRFDIFNGNSRSSLVTGGVFARLGAGDDTSPARAESRRFYYAPDVALIQRRGADAYYNLAIGSGYRGHPLETDTDDRFYALRDKLPFSKLTQSAYNAFTPVTENDLENISSDPAGSRVPVESRGWYLELGDGGNRAGEKVLAEALTVNGTILFPTYQPTPPSSIDPCRPSTGTNRVYALSVDAGRPAIDFSDDQVLTNDDLFTELAQAGIAGEVGYTFESVSDLGGVGGGDGQPGSGNGEGAEGVDALGRRGSCVVGVEVLKKCVNPGDVVRTFWERQVDGGGG